MSDVERSGDGLAGNVRSDIPCDECGYNLRTMPIDGHCPECNFPVSDSIHANEVRGDVGKLSDPYLGAIMMACAILAVPLAGLFVLFFESALPSDIAAAVVLCVLPLAAIVYWVGTLSFVPFVPHLEKQWAYVANYVRLAPLVTLFLLFLSVPLGGWVLPTLCGLILWFWILSVLLIARRYAAIARARGLVVLSMICFWIGIGSLPVEFAVMLRINTLGTRAMNRGDSAWLAVSMITLSLFWLLYAVDMFLIALMIRRARNMSASTA